MTSTRLVPVETLHRIVEVASRAPSVHNTQPWRWRGGSHTLELYADRSRQLRATDPDGRNLTLSCGVALHHAQVAAGALGWETRVARHPDPAQPDLLAFLDLTPGPMPATADETLTALDQRCTDRRRFTAWPVPEERQAHLARLANHWGARAVALTDESERFIAERLVRRAQQLQWADPSARAEQAAWQHRGTDDGLPVDSLPGPHDLAGTHPHRFQGAWEERAVPDLDAATTAGLALVPLSQVIEVPETRSAFQTEVLGSLAHPLLLVRVGWRSTARPLPARTPRRPVSEVLELD
jgi:hypothetical protein